MTSQPSAPDTTVHDPFAIARLAVEIAEDRQAHDILLLDVREISSYADAFVLLTVESKRQGEAIRDAMDIGLKSAGQRVLRTEGDADSGWILMDFNDLIVHVFSSEARDLYRLEELWYRAAPLLRIQ